MAWQKHLIKFLAVSAGKKLILFGIAKMYGVPNVYRRTLELNKKVFKKPETRKVTANLIKQGFLLPNTIGVKLGLMPQRPIRTSSIINSSNTSNTVVTSYTPSRLIIPSHPHLPVGSIRNPNTSTPTTQTTTTTTSTSASASTIVNPKNENASETPQESA